METAAVSATTASTNNTPTILSEEEAGAIDADFETFLNLLTAQLKNQDPLNPADSTEFVAQLAQFSAVEQQVKSNNTLESILEAVGGGATGLADYLGSEVLAEDALEFRGDPIALTVEPSLTATSANLVVRDDEGRVVSRETVDPTASELTWDGGDADDGFYTFAVERFDGGATLGEEAAKGFSPVVEARLVNGSPVLILAGGGEINQNDLLAVRAPQTDD